MNSGAPASIAPPQSASAGRMLSHIDRKVLYWCAEKNFGKYSPALAFAFSVWITLCAYAAASSGMARSTEPATAPMVSDFSTLRRETDSAAIGCALELSFFSLVEQIL